MKMKKPTANQPSRKALEQQQWQQFTARGYNLVISPRDAAIVYEVLQRMARYCQAP